MEIPYFYGRKLRLDIFRSKRRGGKLTFMLTLLFRDRELAKHCEGEWFLKNWWFLKLPF